MIAPIALFAYNRPQHTRRTVQALAANELAIESHLYVFSDAARSLAESANVQAVRDYIGTISGFKSIDVVYQPINLGLASSITSGVTKICREYGRVIVVEDDLVTSPYFLQYINAGLTEYEHQDAVISIHGYVYPILKELPETFFLRGADCWGWGTWLRGWELFSAAGTALLEELERRNLTKQFDFDGTFPYTQMLRDQIAGRNDSWAIRWYASAFLANKLTLYPGRSLIRNIGMDATGRHSPATDNLDVALTRTPVPVVPLEPTENIVARRAFEEFFRRQARRASMARAYHRALRFCSNMGTKVAGIPRESKD